jgi:hypothetical protein
VRESGAGGRAPARVALVGVVAALLVTSACGRQEDPATGTTPAPPAQTSEGPTTSAPTGTTAPEDTGTTSPGDSWTPGEQPTTGTETAAPTATDVPADPDEDFLAADEVSTGEQAGNPDLLVTGVRLGAHETYDRVVLDLEGTGTPGWRVRYEDNPALDGSGAPVDLAGSHTLVVTVTGTRYPEPGENAYDPGQLLVRAGGLTVVTEVLRGAPFEGQLDVFIGTREEAPFRVFTLEDPERLVIDVARR